MIVGNRLTTSLLVERYSRTEYIFYISLETADFLLKLNNSFDLCNSQQLNDKNPNQRSTNVQNRQIFENINKTISTLKVGKKLCHKNNIISVPPCFIGMISSLNALILLYETEKKI